MLRSNHQISSISGSGMQRSCRSGHDLTVWRMRCAHLDTQDNHLSPAAQLPSRQNVLPRSMEQNYPHPGFVLLVN